MSAMSITTFNLKKEKEIKGSAFDFEMENTKMCIVGTENHL